MNSKTKVYHIALLGDDEPNTAIGRAFKTAGYTYLELDWQKYLKQHGIEELRKKIITDVKVFKPNLVFMQLQTAGIVDSATAKKIKEYAFVVNWTGDIRTDINWYLELADDVDITLFTNLTDVLTLRDAGKKADLLQIGYDELIYNPWQTSEKFPEIVFLANNYLGRIDFPLVQERYDLVNFMYENFPDRFQVFGNGWTDRVTRKLLPADEAKCYRKAKIAISQNHFDRINYSSDRMFRIMACGGALCLTKKIPIYGDSFIIPDEYLDNISWENFDQLKRLCERYISPDNEQERAMLVKHAKNKMEESGTWHSRIKELFEMAKKHDHSFKLVPGDNWHLRLNSIPEIKKYSQTGEEGIIAFILSKLRIKEGFLVDLGASDFHSNSNSRYFVDEYKFGHILIDGAGDGETVKKEWITAENIIDLLKKYQCPKEFDLLNIDLDGNDWYILDKVLSCYAPKIIIAEINPIFDLHEDAVIEYNAQHQWGDNDYYGMSLLALHLLAEKHQFSIVHLRESLNAILVSNEFIGNISSLRTLHYQVKHDHKYGPGKWVCASDLIKAQQKELAEYKEVLPDAHVLMPYQWEPFNGDTFMADDILALKKKHRIHTVIECGTCLGSSTLWLSRNFVKVFTIEVNKTFLDIANKRFEKTVNVTAIHGDSAVEIKKLLPKITNNSLIFIDSHWEQSVPMPDELEAIAASGLKPVIVIHDFKNPDHPDFGFDSYNGQPFDWNWIKPFIEKIYGADGYNVSYNQKAKGAKRGVIYITGNDHVPQVTAVFTSCGRQELLEQTIDSFIKYNSYPVAKYIVVEDSGVAGANDALKLKYKDHNFLWIENETNIGQIMSIDKAYKEVTTPYVFHCEDDWAFFNTGFIEKSLEVLKENKGIIQVWIRSRNDTNGHPIEPGFISTSSGISFSTLKPGYAGVWHGFSFNPGLKRMVDYTPYSAITHFRPDQPGESEKELGAHYHSKGFKAAILTEGYVRHSGYGKTVKPKKASGNGQPEPPSPSLPAPPAINAPAFSYNDLPDSQHPAPTTLAPFNGNHSLCSAILKFKEEHASKNIVHFGMRDSDSILWLAENFDKVYVIENMQTAWDTFMPIFKQHSLKFKVKRYFGEITDMLRHAALPFCDASTLFYVHEGMMPFVPGIIEEISKKKIQPVIINLPLELLNAPSETNPFNKIYKDGMEAGTIESDNGSVIHFARKDMRDKLADEKVTLIAVTSGRKELLERTLKSFTRMNTFKGVVHTIIADASNGNRIEAIDGAYKQVQTPYVFHVEEGWEFFGPSFIETSMHVLREYPDVVQVRISSRQELNGHPAEKILKSTSKGDQFSYLATGYGKIWHGFSFDPGLKRMADYSPFMEMAGYNAEDGTASEAAAGDFYFKKGMKAVILHTAYVKKIGKK